MNQTSSSTPVADALAASGWSRMVARIHPARPVYGSIIVLASVMGIDEADATAGQSLFAVLATLVAIVLAEAYADLVGVAIHERRRLRGADVRAITINMVGAGVAAVPPVIAFTLAALDVISLHLAGVASIWFLVGVLFLAGFLAARAAGARPVERWLLGGILLAVGLVLVFIKVVVVHL